MSLIKPIALTRTTHATDSNPTLATFDSRYVLFKLSSANEEQAIRSVAALLETNQNVIHAGRLADEMVRRERLSSTALDTGVAFAHARTPFVRDLVLAVGCSPDGIPFGAARRRVHLLFVIGTPPDHAAQYLQLVGTLARRLKDCAGCQKLVMAASFQEFMRFLRGGP